MKKNFILFLIGLLSFGSLQAQVIKSEWENAKWISSEESYTTFPLYDNLVMMCGSGFFDAGYGKIVSVNRENEYFSELKVVPMDAVNLDRVPQELRDMLLNFSWSDPDEDVWERENVDGKDLLVWYRNDEILSIYCRYEGETDGSPLMDVTSKAVQNMICGNYTSANGKMFSFNENGSCIFNGIRTTYKLMRNNDAPNNVIELANGKLYRLNVTTEGLNILNVTASEEEFDGFSNGSLFAKVSASKEKPRFAFLQDKPLQVSVSAISDEAVEVYRLMRNELYAIHGYVFSNAKLKEYFQSCPWYEAADSNDHVHLSKMQMMNVSYIKHQEKNN